VKEEFQQLAEVGVCRPSKSRWASPIVTIMKKGKLRIAGDYKRLNSQTLPDRYPLPNLFDSTAQLHDCVIFSKIDLIRAYFNIPVFKDDVEKTAVISPAGLFEFEKMPFGLKNAPATFMRFINEVLGDLPFLFVYLDDILIFSKNETEHTEHISIVFQRLAKYGLTINLNKCEFCVTDLDFLGHNISRSGFRPTDSRVKYIKNLSKPETINGLRRTLGIFNFYRRFNKKAAQTLAPLNDILKGRSRKNDRTPVPWTPALEQSFEKAKYEFSNYTLLHFPNNECKLMLTTDASNIAYGGVLEQITVLGKRQPLAFFSGKFSEQQQKWSTFDRELYAMYASCEHFEYLIEGREVILVTDHKPLLSIFRNTHKLSRRSRHVEFIAQFSTNIKHVSGASNVVADALSRPHVDEIVRTLLLEDIVREQTKDEEIESIRRNGYRDQVMKSVKINGIEVLCSVFQGANRPVIPKKYRLHVFKQIHNLAHPGTRSTLKLMRSKYFWPNMTRDIRKWSRACHDCQRTKISRHTKTELGCFPESDRLEHIHCDIVHMEEDNGFKYLFTIIDRATRWTEAIPLKNITTEDVATAFATEWISRFGSPLTLTTDRGSQFTSEQFKEVCKFLGCHNIQTTAYNPKANGAVERYHRQFKAAITSHGKNWMTYLPVIKLGLRVAPKKNGHSPAEMLYGKNLILPGEFLQPSTEITDTFKFVRNLREAFKEISPFSFSHNRKIKVFVPQDLNTSEKVYVRVDKVRKPLEPPYIGPFKVIKRCKKYFRLRYDNGKEDTVAVDRLKPAFILSDDQTDSKEPIIAVKKSNLKVKNDDIVNMGKESKVPIPTVSKPQVTFSPDVSLQNLNDKKKQKKGYVPVDRTNRGRTIVPPVRYRA
jgi:cleavage and polyadenylation specificity factor subunit 1